MNITVCWKFLYLSIYIIRIEGMVRLRKIDLGLHLRGNRCRNGNINIATTVKYPPYFILFRCVTFFIRHSCPSRASGLPQIARAGRKKNRIVRCLTKTRHTAGLGMKNHPLRSWDIPCRWFMRSSETPLRFLMTPSNKVLMSSLSHIPPA